MSIPENMRDIPNCNIVNWMPSVGHDAEGMMASNGCTK